MVSGRQSVLIIGGAGFIGSSVCARLAGLGWDVHAVVRSPAACPLGDVCYHVGDITEQAFIEPLLGSCRTVIHTASATTPGSSSRSPVAELRRNLEPTLRFLEVARERAPESLVFLSSGGTLYADPTQPPIEGARPCARSYHGAGKIALEAFLGTFARETGCRLVTLRPSNVYGPGQSLRRGFGFVRVALEMALRREPMEIWGDGSAERDFLYIDDLVDVVAATAANGAVHGVLNVGSGSVHRLTEVLDLVGRVTGRSLDVTFRPGRKSDVHSGRIDVRKIGELLRWQPTVELQAGVGRTWEWLRREASGRHG